MTNSQKMLVFAREQLGKLYDHGDHGLPSDMWDCSGLTMEMAELCGKKWPHTSNGQYELRDFTRRGTIDTLPDKDVFLFKYGKRTNGEMGMIHVGAYDAATGKQIQAGGNSPFVCKEEYEQCLADGMTRLDAVQASLWTSKSKGTKKSTVSEMALTKSYWTHWAWGPWMDAEITATVVEPPEAETLRKGSEGEAVKDLQARLNAWNETLPEKKFAALEIDGRFGALTYQAVREYQESIGLFVDGIVGPLTWNALDKKPVDESQTDYAVLITHLSALEAEELVTQYYPNAAIRKD